MLRPFYIQPFIVYYKFRVLCTLISSSCGRLVAFDYQWGPFGPLTGGQKKMFRKARNLTAGVSGHLVILTRW